MQFIYNISIFLYSAAIRMASLFNNKAKRWIKGRENLFRNLASTIKKDKPITWFHCASLGEFEQGRPLIEEFRIQNPEYRILLTFFSPSGYEIRKNYSGADYVFYLPMDTFHNAEKFIGIVKPRIVFFIKYEFWFNYLNILKKENIPTFLISANFRSDQHFFKWYGKWFQNMLKFFTHIFVQNETSKLLLKSISIDKVTVTGDTRFDRVYNFSLSPKPVPIIDSYKGNHEVLIAGSTWPEDEAILIQWINNLTVEDLKKIKIIIAPHEIKAEGIQKIISLSKVNTVRLSQANEENIHNNNLLIIDNIGMLSSLYQYGAVAYIGGGFGKGIHNILEAAAYGMPIICGPNYEKFQEAKDLIELGGAFSIDSYGYLEKQMNKLLSDKRVLKNTGETSRDYVKANKGATEKIMLSLKQLLSI